MDTLALDRPIFKIKKDDSEEVAPRADVDSMDTDESVKSLYPLLRWKDVQTEEVELWKRALLEFTHRGPGSFLDEELYTASVSGDGCIDIARSFHFVR